MAKDTQTFAAGSQTVEKKKRQRKLDAEGNPIPSKIIVVFTVDRAAQNDKDVLNVIGMTRNGTTALQLVESNPGATYKMVNTGN